MMFRTACRNGSRFCLLRGATPFVVLFTTTTTAAAAPTGRFLTSIATRLEDPPHRAVGVLRASDRSIQMIALRLRLLYSFGGRKKYNGSGTARSEQYIHDYKHIGSFIRCFLKDLETGVAKHKLQAHKGPPG
jgi:hypothetical protein